MTAITSIISMLLSCYDQIGTNTCDHQLHPANWQIMINPDTIEYTEATWRPEYNCLPMAFITEVLDHEFMCGLSPYDLYNLARTYDDIRQCLRNLITTISDGPLNSQVTHFWLSFFNRQSIGVRRFQWKEMSNLPDDPLSPESRLVVKPNTHAQLPVTAVLQDLHLPPIISQIKHLLLKYPWLDEDGAAFAAAVQMMYSWQLPVMMEGEYNVPYRPTLTWPVDGLPRHQALGHMRELHANMANYMMVTHALQMLSGTR